MNKRWCSTHQEAQVLRMNIILRRWRRAPRKYFALCPDEKNPDKPVQCRCIDLDPFFKGLVGSWVNYENAIHDSKPASENECPNLVTGITLRNASKHPKFVKHQPTWNRHYKKRLPCPTN
jgi:hypothetical protein